jgi:hypothetical protein
MVDGYEGPGREHLATNSPHYDSREPLRAHFADFGGTYTFSRLFKS